MKFISLLFLLTLVGCQSTNYNDVMSAWVQSQERVAQINAERDVKVAQAKATEVQALVQADSGGVTIQDPESGFVTTYRNPNPYLYNQGSFVTNNITKTLQAATNIPLPQKQKTWWEKAGGYTVGILDRTVNTALNNAVGVFGIVENNKTQRTVAEYNFKSDEVLYNTIGGLGNNIAEVSNNAIAGNVDVSQSALSEMKQTSVAFAEMTEANIEAYTDNYKNNTSILISETNNTSTSTSNTHIEDYGFDMDEFFENMATIYLTEEEDE